MDIQFFPQVFGRVCISAYNDGNEGDGVKPVLPEDMLTPEHDLTFEEFEAIYPQLRKRMGWRGMGHGLMEDFNIYKRDRTHFTKFTPIEKD